MSDTAAPEADTAQNPLNTAMEAVVNPQATPAPAVEEPFKNLFSEIPVNDTKPPEKPDKSVSTDTSKPTKAKKGVREYEEVKLEDIPDEAPEGSTDKAKAHWGHLKQAAKVAETKAAEAEAAKADYEKKLAELEARVPDLEKNSKFVEEAERELSIHKIEASREYKNVVDVPLEAIENEIIRIAKKYEIEPLDIAKAFQESDPDKREDMLEEITTGMRTASKNQIMEMAADTLEIYDKRDKLRARAVEAKGQLEKTTAESEAKAKEEFKKNYGSKVGEVMKQLSDRLPFVPIKEGDTAAALIAAIEKSAKESEFDSASPSTQAYAVVAVHALPHVVAQTRTLQVKLAAAEKRIAELQAAKPGTGGDGDVRSNDTATPPPSWIPGR